MDNSLYHNSYDKSREQLDITTWLLPFQLCGDSKDIIIHVGDCAVEGVLTERTGAEVIERRRWQGPDSPETENVHGGKNVTL